MGRLITALVAVLLGVVTSIAVGASDEPTLVVESADGMQITLECPTEIVRTEGFLWGMPPGGSLPDNTPGPVGGAQVRERIPGAIELSARTLIVERSPGEARLVVELLADGRVDRVTWCAGEEGVTELLPELDGGRG